MEETNKEVPSGSNCEPTTNPMIVEEIVASPNICVVCGDIAKYSYYGGIVCQSCKVFFRRNAQNRSISLVCHFDDNCDININSRRSCTSCRLAKCISSGMNADLIRSDRGKQKKKKSRANALVELSRINKHQQIRPLNLLERDQSTLNVDQWNHLTNLVNCFDEYSGGSLIQQFIDEQTCLPPKFRFKYSPVNDFYRRMMTNVQLVFEKNRNNISLSSDDRCLLLRSTIENTTNFGAAFLLKQYQLLDFPDFFRSSELIFNSSAIAFIKRLIDQLDPDIIFLKMLLGLIAFLISNYTVYQNKTANHLKDANKIISIQNMYAELIWKYLIYKHNYRDAVLCFLNIVRCLFLVNDSIVQAHEHKQFTDIMDSIIQSTELKLNLNC